LGIGEDSRRESTSNPEEDTLPKPLRASIVSNETVEKPIDNLAGLAEGVDLGGVLFFLRISALA
jgi:hypothetical protein